MFKEFHAHIYFAAKEVEEVTPLLFKIKKDFGFSQGRVWENPVGPHPIGSCQITFLQESFSSFVSWLMVNRGKFDVFIHAVTGDDWLDHTQNTLWLGRSHPLNLDIFAKS